MFHDLRYAVRGLLRKPSVAIVAILTLGLAIGANTAIFTVVNAVLLRPLPYPEADRLVRIHTAFNSLHNDRYWLSGPEYTDLRAEVKSFQALSAWVTGTATFGEIDRPVRVTAAYTSPGFASVLGVAPERGRYFGPDEAVRGQDPRVAVISHDLWQGAFAADPRIVGRPVSLDGTPVTIIGVMPAGFAYPAPDVEAWVPFAVDEPSSAANRGGHSLYVVGRLGAGVSLDDVRAELGAFTTRMGRLDSPTFHALDPAEHPLTVFPLRGEVVGAARAPLWLLQAAVFFVLLIACANVSNLLLARTEERSREIAVRVALGAGRGRLIRLFLLEGLLLGLAAAAAGVLAAVWGVDLAASLMPAGAPRAAEISVDVRVLLFALGCALAATVLFGLTPLAHTRAADLHASLKEGGRTGTGRSRLRRAIVTVEVALAVVLVVGCGLAVRSFVRLAQVDVGFRPEGLLTFELEVPAVRYETPDAVLAFWKRLAGELRAVPGVDGVTLSNFLPSAQTLATNVVWYPGAPAFNVKGAPVIDYWTIVGDDYFATLGHRLIAGRTLRPDDTASIVVNETLAKKFFPGEDAVGKPIHIAPWLEGKLGRQTIVGVVADVKQQGLDTPSGTEAYIPLAFTPALNGRAPLTMRFALRSARPGAIAGAVEATVRGLDPSLPLSKVRTMETLLWDAVARPRFLTFVLGILGGLALVLSVTGVYSVMSMSVAQRTRELGIRMALGARAGGVQRMVLGQGMVLVGGGMIVGLCAALALVGALSGVLGRVLYHTAATDPLVFAAVGALVGLAAALACWLPARRATRVDPMVALRTD